MPPSTDIQVAAIVLIRDRRVLMVTARHRAVYYMPGGKIDGGETPVDGLRRETHEELGTRVVPGTERLLFTVRAQADGEPTGRCVAMHCFAAKVDAEPVASSEVSALHWVSSDERAFCPPAGKEVLTRLAKLDLID